MSVSDVGIGVGQRERGAGRWRRTDRRCRSAGREAGEVSFCAWPIAEPGRSSGRCGPRPQTRSRRASSPATHRDEPSAKRGKFFESLDDPLVLRRMRRPCAHVREAELMQKFADIARMKVDPEPLGDDPLEVDPPPAHDAVLLTIRTRLDDLCQRSQPLRRKARLGTLGPGVEQARAVMIGSLRRD